MEKNSLDLPVELEGIIQRWITWRRLRRALSWALSGTLFGLATALGFSLAILGQSILVLSSFILLAAACGLVGMGAFALAGYLWRITPQETTRFFDRQFQLFERTSTALELSVSGDHPSHSHMLV